MWFDEGRDACLNSDPEAPRTSSLSPGRGAGASQEGEGGSVRSARRAALQRQDLQRRCSDAWGRREADGRASSFPVCAPLTSLPCFTAQARTCRAVSTAPVRTGPLTLFPACWGSGPVCVLFTESRKLSSIAGFLRTHIMSGFRIVSSAFSVSVDTIVIFLL